MQQQSGGADKLIPASGCLPYTSSSDESPRVSPHSFNAIVTPDTTVSWRGETVVSDQSPTMMPQKHDSNAGRKDGGWTAVDHTPSLRDEQDRPSDKAHNENRNMMECDDDGGNGVTWAGNTGERAASPCNYPSVSTPTCAPHLGSEQMPAAQSPMVAASSAYSPNRDPTHPGDARPAKFLACPDVPQEAMPRRIASEEDSGIRGLEGLPFRNRATTAEEPKRELNGWAAAAARLGGGMSGLASLTSAAEKMSEPS